MKLPIQAGGVRRVGAFYERSRRAGISPSLRIGGGGGGLPVKCESDTGDVCNCGPGKCCVAAPNGCVCQPCGGGPTGPPPTTAFF
jgi:hypothetical protein